MRGCLSKKEKTNMNNLEIFVFSRFRVLLGILDFFSNLINIKTGVLMINTYLILLEIKVILDISHRQILILS